MHTFPLLLTALSTFAALTASAAVVEYTLDVREENVSPAGKPVPGLTLNGTIPGPTLRFREGDTARIHVRNHLATEEVSTHWHGLLLPNVEDGVPYLTTPPIHPGQSRTFEFPLIHAGTFWYHSHTGLQEQRGLYGGIVIEPKKGERIASDHDVVVVLSDWTNENPSEVMRSLMRGTDWYAIRKGTAQSLVGAWQAGHLRDYFKREQARLLPMDVSDVAYDAFLLNGLKRSTLAVKPGEKIRLRVINAGASTYFYLNSATGPLTIIAADGNDVRPIQQNRLLIGMAETYDLLLTIPADGAWEFRATAQDGSGHTSLFLGQGAEKNAPGIERLNPYSMNASLAAILDQLDETGNVTEAEALANEKPRPLPPYKRLQSLTPTTFPRSSPVRRVQLRLSGDMMRYLWTINGTTLTEQSTIPVKRGEVLQFELVNDSMMHHPMHLHGHFFRLLMEDGPDPKFAPLKHTVDVPPMAKRVIEFHANEEKDWAFHCHLLYHMHAGMMKVVSYDNQGPDHKPALAPDHRDSPNLYLDGNLQNHLSSGYLRLMDARNDYGVMWDTGWGNHARDQRQAAGGPSAEYEVDVLWMRYLNPRWMTLAGYRFTNREEDDEDTAFAGFTYRLPYLVDFTGTVESNGDLRAILSKNFQITSRLSLLTRATYDTAQQWSGSVGLNYTLTKQFGLITTFDFEQRLGAGLSFKF